MYLSGIQNDKEDLLQAMTLGGAIWLLSHTRTP